MRLAATTAIGAAAAVLSLGLAVRALAHHTSRISYVMQKVGEKTADCYSVELIAFPPKRFLNKEKPAPKNIHKILDRFSHHFKVIVRDRSKGSKEIRGIRLRVKFSLDDWNRTIDLRSFTENGSPAYGANVSLGPRGVYEVIVSLEGTALLGCGKNLPGTPTSVSFSFEYDFESVKQVMRAMEKSMRWLGEMTLTLGLDGELVSPQTKALIQKRAGRFKELIPWTVNLREGAGQEIYEDRAAKLLEVAEGMEAAASKADYGALVRGLAAARAVCAGCHMIFQEADSEGGAPKIPPAKK